MRDKWSIYELIFAHQNEGMSTMDKRAYLTIVPPNKKDNNDNKRFKIQQRSNQCKKQEEEG